MGNHSTHFRERMKPEQLLQFDPRVRALTMQPPSPFPSRSQTVSTGHVVDMKADMEKVRTTYLHLPTPYFPSYTPWFTRALVFCLL